VPFLVAAVAINSRDDDVDVRRVQREFLSHGPKHFHQRQLFATLVIERFVNHRFDGVVNEKAIGLHAVDIDLDLVNNRVNLERKRVVEVCSLLFVNHAYVLADGRVNAFIDLVRLPQFGVPVSVMRNHSSYCVGKALRHCNCFGRPELLCRRTQTCSRVLGRERRQQFRFFFDFGRKLDRFVALRGARSREDFLFLGLVFTFD
jgi:hypothetical protein